MSEDQDHKSTPAERRNIRRWILKIVTDYKSTGATVQQIKKFLDSKQDGLSSNPQVKLTLKQLLETGSLKKSDNKKYVASKATSGSGKAKKKTPKSNSKKASPKRATKKAAPQSED